MSRRLAATVLAVLLAAAPAAAQPRPDLDAVPAGAVVRSNVDRTLGKVERATATADGQRALVVASYDQPPRRKVVPARLVASVNGVVRLSVGKPEFDALPDAP